MASTARTRPPAAQAVAPATDAPAAEAPAAEAPEARWVAARPVRHNGRTYKPGESVPGLTDAQAARLGTYYVAPAQTIN